MSTAPNTDKRVQFDFEIDFTNGGGIQGQGFRLDIPGDDISDDVLATCMVRDMRLLMVGEVRILNREIVVEKHKRAAPSGATPRFIDLSHDIEDGMITYRGLPAPVICDYLSREQSRSHYANGTEFQIGKIEMVANTGTYLDSPFHRYLEGKDLSELPLPGLAGLDGVMVRAGRAADRAIGPAAFRGLDVRGRAVLIRTGWDAHWRTDRYFEGHPFLTQDTAAYLVEAGAVLVGIDSLNIDDTDNLRRPVHSILLGAEIPIVEHLRGLDQLPESGFSFSAVPVKVKGCGTFPVRAFATVDPGAT